MIVNGLLEPGNYMPSMRVTRTVKFLFLAAAFACGCLAASADELSKRYVNPLSIDDVRSVADPRVLRFQGKF